MQGGSSGKLAGALRHGARGGFEQALRVVTNLKFRSMSPLPSAVLGCSVRSPQFISILTDLMAGLYKTEVLSSPRLST